jgi:hypothetical protein
MNSLDKLLEDYAPPPVPEGLAQRAAVAATRHPQEANKALPWRRRDPRGGWKRPFLIAGASLALVFTSAVAAEVASSGRIEIPVVHQMVERIPILDVKAKPARKLAEAKVEKREPARVQAQSVPPAPPNFQRRERVAQRFAQVRQMVGARRAAGLPTPRADRIEAQAKRIVERRQAAGKPTPPVERVEGLLALREIRHARQQRRATQQIVASRLTDEQVRRVAERLPPERRERFLALPPEVQRQMIARRVEGFRTRRAMRRAMPQTAPQEQPVPRVQTAPEPPVESESEGFSEEPR